jgi:hypothetical protein
MAEALHLVGGSIACLVAALQAARRGHAVTLHADPARLGGTFAGLRHGGHKLNLGIRVLELDSELPRAQRRPPRCFDPARDQHRPFIDAIRHFVEEVLGEDLVQVPAPEMLLGGRRAACALTTADISGLPPMLDAGRRARIAAEAAALLSDPAPPPWRFLPDRPARLAEAGLEVASRDNHGETLHRLLLQPVAARLDPDWAAGMASERRKLWVALFHPQTVLEAFRGEQPGFRPDRHFWGTRRGFGGRLVEALLERLSVLPGLRIEPTGRLLRFSPDGTLHFAATGETPPRQLRPPPARTAIGLGPEELFPAAGCLYAPQRLRAGFAWVEVAEADLLHSPFSLLLCDPDAAAFRISVGGITPRPGHHVLTLEFGRWEAGSPPPDVLRAGTALVQAGLLRPRAPLRLLHSLVAPCLVAPSFANHARFARARAEFAELGWAGRLFGGANRFGFESLNDQIVEGLHFGDTA